MVIRWRSMWFDRARSAAAPMVAPARTLAHRLPHVVPHGLDEGVGLAGAGHSLGVDERPVDDLAHLGEA